MELSAALLSKYHSNPQLRTKFIEFVSNIVTDERCQLINRIASERTRYLTVVLENLFQPQNASAVLRSCECMGVQDVHIIENYNNFEVNPEIDMSASKWLSLNKYNLSEVNTTAAIGALKKQGYRIVATSPHVNDCNLHDFDVQKGKFALLFGTERQGLTPEALSMADEFIKIPMFGFIESYNISVSVALCLYDLLNRIKSEGVDYKLNSDERDDLRLRWLLLSVNKLDGLENRFLSENRIFFSKNC